MFWIYKVITSTCFTFGRIQFDRDLQVFTVTISGVESCLHFAWTDSMVEYTSLTVAWFRRWALRLHISVLGQIGFEFYWLVCHATSASIADPKTFYPDAPAAKHSTNKYPTNALHHLLLIYSRRNTFLINFQ